MPMVSQAQRGMFWKARNDPAFAKRKGLKMAVVKEFTDADKGGKLPKHKSRGEKWYGSAGH